MKPFLLPLLFVLTLGVPILRADTIVLADRVLLDASVRKLDAFTARITHSDGVATVPAWDLSPDAQRKAGFDPVVTAAEHRRLIAAAQAAAEAKAEAARAEAARIAAAEAAARQAAMEKREQDRREEERRIAARKKNDEEWSAASALMKKEIQNPQSADPLARRLRALSRALEVARQSEALSASANLMRASAGDQLAAVGWQRELVRRGGKPYTAADLAGFSQEGVWQIETYVPGLAPKELRLSGRLEIEMEKLERELLPKFVQVVRAEKR